MPAQPPDDALDDALDDERQDQARAWRRQAEARQGLASYAERMGVDRVGGRRTPWPQEEGPVDENE